MVPKNPPNIAFVEIAIIKNWKNRNPNASTVAEPYKVKYTDTVFVNLAARKNCARPEQIPTKGRMNAIRILNWGRLIVKRKTSGML